MRYLVISAGSLEDQALLTKLIDHNTRVICADGGANYLADFGIVPDLIIGDMDSIKIQNLLTFTRQGSRIRQYPTVKDETDTALALMEALSDTPDEVIILGATGSRLDHTLANVHLLKMAAEKGVPARIVDAYQEISLITKRTPASFFGIPEEVFSLLPLSEEVTGVTITGAKWSMRNQTFYLGYPYGVSNEVLGGKVGISVVSGMLLLIRVREKGDMIARFAEDLSL